MQQKQRLWREIYALVPLGVWTQPHTQYGNYKLLGVNLKAYVSIFYKTAQEISCMLSCLSSLFFSLICIIRLKGQLEMFVDIFPDPDKKPPGPPVNIATRKAKDYFLRVIIWNTTEVPPSEKSITGEEMNDLYLKGSNESRILVWLLNFNVCQISIMLAINTPTSVARGSRLKCSVNFWIFQFSKPGIVEVKGSLVRHVLIRHCAIFCFAQFVVKKNWEKKI